MASTILTALKSVFVIERRQLVKKITEAVLLGMHSSKMFRMFSLATVLPSLFSALFYTGMFDLLFVLLLRVIPSLRRSFLLLNRFYPCRVEFEPNQDASEEAHGRESVLEFFEASGDAPCSVLDVRRDFRFGGLGDRDARQSPVCAIY